MEIVTATSADLDGWLALAAEVESLFGPMVDDPMFRATLLNNFARCTAFCVRATGESSLPGGLLWSPERLEIVWLAVAARHRRSGIGRSLVEHALSLVRRPATVRVTTFAADVAGGGPARRLYESVGFKPSADGARSPGSNREVLAIHLG